jgi:hypothetical protein
VRSAATGAARVHAGEASVLQLAPLDGPARRSADARATTCATRHIEELAGIYAGHPTLRARYARWVRTGEASFQQALQPTAAAAHNPWSARLAGDLTGQRLDDRAEYLLGTVLDEAGVECGLLFRIDAMNLLLMAAQPSRPEAHMLRAARARYSHWQRSEQLDTALGHAPLDEPGALLAPLWLTHPARPEHPIGLVLLRCEVARLAQLSAAFRARPHRASRDVGALTT